MMARLLERRVRWGFTRIGWIVLLTVFAVPAVVWWFWAETFFSRTWRVPSKILVVECWIGTRALQAAAQEFQEGHYDVAVLAGGYADDRWSLRRTSLVAMARETMLSEGLKAEQIRIAQASPSHSQRTYASAEATWRALEAAGRVGNVNVFTLAAHARRSQLVYAKAAPRGIQVGVVAWVPPEYARESWWQSSERGEEVIKETAALFYERFLNSGRRGGL